MSYEANPSTLPEAVVRACRPTGGHRDRRPALQIASHAQQAAHLAAGRVRGGTRSANGCGNQIKLVLWPQTPEQVAIDEALDLARCLSRVR